MRYLKNNTKLLVNCLFSMYFAKLSPSQPTNPRLGAEIALFSEPGVNKTGIRGIQDTRQIVDGKTNDIENNDKKGGSKPLT